VSETHLVVVHNVAPSCTVGLRFSLEPNCSPLSVIVAETPRYGPVGKFGGRNETAGASNDSKLRPVPIKLYAMTLAAKPMFDPGVERQIREVEAVQLEVGQPVLPKKAVNEVETAPKFMPLTVTLAPAEAGKLPPMTPVMTGLSYENPRVL